MNRLFSASLLLALSLPPAICQAQFTGMRPRIPTDANTLVLMNFDKMFGSRVADRDNWDARRKAAYDSGILAVPPDASSVILAARHDLEYGDAVWELALLKLNQDRNVSTVAARFGGAMDTILGRSATRLPNDQYVVQISPQLLGAHTPANRQDVTRWLRSTDTFSAQDRFSPYLQQAFDYATKVGTPIVMAIDMDGMISSETVQKRLASLESLQGVDLPLDQLAKLINGTKGITLGITLQDQTVGAIRVDFDQPPKLLEKVGKPLLMEILGRHGAMIDDIHDWQPSISGNTFLLRGTFSQNGTRRVLSILELPRSLTDSLQDAQSPGSDPEGTAKLLATQQYYQSVATLLDDLRGKGKGQSTRTFGQTAIWYDRYARKLDHFPILNVDEDMVNYGVRMATLLRDAEMVMKGVGMRTSLRTASNNPVSGGFSYSVGGYRANTGYSRVSFGPNATGVSLGPGRASLQEKGRTDAIIRGQERTSGASNVQQIWQQIDEDTAAVRRSMTNKYSAEF